MKLTVKNVLELTVKKNVLEKIVKAMGFAEEINFFCCRPFVFVQAYKLASDEVLADVKLSPKSSGVLDNYSLNGSLLNMGFKVELLSDELKGAEGFADSFITIEGDYRTRNAKFRVHSHLGGEDEHDEHNFTLKMLDVYTSDHYSLHNAFQSFNLSAKLSKSEFRSFSNKCADWVLKGVDTVYIEISDSRGFELFTCSDEESRIKEDLIRVEADIPTFDRHVCNIFTVRYLDYFTKVNDVTSDVIISFATEYPVLRITYELTDKDYINFYLGPRPIRVEDEDVLNISDIQDDFQGLEVSDTTDPDEEYQSDGSSN